MMTISEEYVREFAEKGLRLDKRKADEFRNVEIETGIIKSAEGSAQVRLGNTTVIAGVKMSVGEPFSDKPDEGVLMVGAELTPIADPDFEPGPPGIQSIEVARVVDRTIRESKMIDVKALKINDEAVWIVNVDLHVMNFDGNLIDAGNLAAVAALATAKMPKYEDGKVNYDERSGALPVTTMPISVTTVKINGMLIVDPTKEEENAADARLTVSVKNGGNVCSLQKGGVEGFTVEELHKALQLAGDKQENLRAALK
ncbi:MAG: exosome complex protein Rrp42 [Candidatus Aenigmarchaeota archaeon]|nr:exosome complex protein Rrp42 [Candidatus Aenigmarchaeota archaeon]